MGCKHAYNDQTITDDGRMTCIYCGEPEHNMECKDKIILANQLLEKMIKKYKQAYNLFMDEAWDNLSDESREYLDKKFKELGL